MFCLCNFLVTTVKHLFIENIAQKQSIAIYENTAFAIPCFVSATEIIPTSIIYYNLAENGNRMNKEIHKMRVTGYCYRHECLQWERVSLHDSVIIL